MINQCLIQFDQNNLEQFIINAKQVLFADFDFVLENDVIYSKILNIISKLKSLCKSIQFILFVFI